MRFNTKVGIFFEVTLTTLGFARTRGRRNLAPSRSQVALDDFGTNGKRAFTLRVSDSETTLTTLGIEKKTKLFRFDIVDEVLVTLCNNFME